MFLGASPQGGWTGWQFGGACQSRSPPKVRRDWAGEDGAPRGLWRPAGQWQGSDTECCGYGPGWEGAARTGAGEDGGRGADTHVTVVLSNCSSRLSMADDCKYGSSLSVCLSVRSVSVLASPVLVLCGCPCPAHTLLRLLTWSSSWSPPLPGTGSWLAHASGPSGMWWVERSWTDGQCRDVGRDREK